MTDREIDALLAEYVLGCHPVPCRGGQDTQEFACTCYEPPEHTNKHSNARLTGRGLNEIPYFTRDIAAAWHLVSTLTHAEPPWLFVLDVGPRAHARFRQYDPQHFAYPASPLHTAKDPSAPRAIALAALKIYESKKEE